MQSFLSNIIILLVRAYQVSLSRILPSTCRFTPSCSNYMIDAIKTYGFLKGINTVAKKLGISVDNGKGYRALANINEHGGQEVPHLHFHLFGGEKVGKMVS